MPNSATASPWKAYYATIAVATLGCVALNFSFDPIKALYWSAVVNGLLAAPLMAVMMVIAMNRRIMSRLTLPRPHAGGRMAGNRRRGTCNSWVLLDLSGDRQRVATAHST